MDFNEMNQSVGMLKLAGVSAEEGMKQSIRFELGDRVTTIGGQEVICTELSDETPGYECALFSDGAWRYNRPHDRGRCTGSAWDAPKNIVPIFPSSMTVVDEQSRS